MSEHFCSLIILGPESPHSFKLHLSRGAITILVLAFLLSFLAVVWVGFNSPPRISDLRRSSLESENRVLKVEATNAVLKIKQLNEKVSALEAQSDRINELLVP